MDKIEKAIEMFRQLEKCDSGNAADIARRMFFIQDRLSSIRN